MPPRLNKRQQRELEELANLGQSSKQQLSDGETSELEIKDVKRPTVGFAALASSDKSAAEDEDEEVTQAKGKKSKKKKKKATANTSAENDAVQPLPKPEPTTPQKQKKQTQKEKSKGKEKGKVKKDVGDDVDRALAELSIKYPDLKRGLNANSQTIPTGFHSISERQNALLAVSLQHLDSEAEMRRFFGSKVIGAAKTRERPLRGGRSSNENVKSNLAKPKANWPSASHREGLTVRAYNETEITRKSQRLLLKIGNEKWWTVEYSKRYRSATKAFIQSVRAGDPERFNLIIRRFWWHADTYLQLSEVYRHREEHSDSADFISRAIFAYERALMGAFTFASGSNRLDFDRVENRPFYLAVSRIISDLQRRGCIRSAFEFARLLLSLDPYTDPHGALLHLEFLAYRAGMHDWVLDMWKLHDEKLLVESDEFGHRFNVTALPGWSYAKALALRGLEDSNKSGNHENSLAALKEAMVAFPNIVPLVADKADISLPGDLRAHPSFRVRVDAQDHQVVHSTDSESVLDLLSHLYAHRCSSLWKIPKHATWFKEVAISAFEYIKNTQTSKSHPLHERFADMFSRDRLQNAALYTSICRHAMLLPDQNASRRLIAFMPTELVRAESLSCDPVPPPTALNKYDADFFADTDDFFDPNRARNTRDTNIPVQVLQALFQREPGLQRHFPGPGGVARFLEAVRNMPQEVLAALVQDDVVDGNDNFQEEILRNPDMFELAEEGADGFADANMFEAADEMWQREYVGGDRDVRDDPADAEAEASGSGTTQEARDGDPDADMRDGEVGEGNEGGQAGAIYPVQILRNLVGRFWGWPAAATGTGAQAENTDSDENENEGRGLDGLDSDEDERHHNVRG